MVQASAEDGAVVHVPASSVFGFDRYHRRLTAVGRGGVAEDDCDVCASAGSVSRIRVSSWA